MNGKEHNSAHSIHASRPVLFCTPRQARALLSEGRSLVLFVRHGLTDWNVAMRLQGRTNVPLNDDGHAQAVKLAELISGVNDKLQICEVYSSPLSRAKDSAQYISEALLGKDPTVCECLIERDYSVLEGLTMAQRKQKFTDTGTYPTDVESSFSAAIRMKKAALDIYEKTGNENSVFVTHGGVINALFSYLTRGRAGNSRSLSANCSIALAASCKTDIIPLAFNLADESFTDYINEIYE